MANTKSAIKRTRKIKRQTAVNRSRKSRYRSALKKMKGLNVSNTFNVASSNKNECSKLIRLSPINLEPLKKVDGTES